MALKSYIVTQDFKSPYVRVTGLPQKPQEIRFKQFKKGEIVNGELKHSNNQPAFVLVKGTLVLPLSVIKELVTKEVSHSAEGSAEKPKEEKKMITIQPSKVKYVDAMIVGALAGFGLVFLAEKQGWIVSVDKKNKIYGAVGGALAGLYLTYRYKNK